MKALLLILFASINLFAQTEINRTVKVNESQTIEIQFDYPELITISTWEKEELEITGIVLINQGENDDAFKLDIFESTDRIKIENHIRDLKNLPKRITAMQGGKKVVFQSKEAFEKYKESNGQPHGGVSYGVDIDISLHIKVPKGSRTSVISTYGIVEVKDFNAPLEVEAKYGGVDVALVESAVGELSAETNYGQIYSNLDAKLLGSPQQNKNFRTLVSATPGSGPHYIFRSQYGNVYLRKVN